MKAEGLSRNKMLPFRLELGPFTSRAFFFPLDQRLWNMRFPTPRPAHHCFADPSGNILGSKLCTGATFYSCFLIFLFLFFFSIFESVCCITDMHINIIIIIYILITENRCLRKKIFIFKLAKHIFVILRGFLKVAKPFWSIWGQNVDTGAIILFFSSYLFLFFSSISSYSSRTIFFLFLHIIIFLYLSCLLYYRHAY